MTILIAGVGYIGAPLAAAYLAQGERVVGLENFFCTPQSALASLREQPGFELIRGSIASAATLERVFSQGPFQVIHLLAAQHSANPQAASASYTERTNLIGPRMLLDLAARHPSSRVVFGSSFHVYGTPLTGTIDESRSYGAFSDMSHLSKVYIEKLLEMYTRTSPVTAVSVRLGIVYGKGPVMKMHPHFQTVPNRFAYLVAAGQPLTVNPSAAHPIGFIHLDDAVTALLAAPELPTAYANANAVGEVLTVPEVAELVTRAAGDRGLSAIVPPSPVEAATPGRFRATSRLREVGWEPRERMAVRIGEVIDHALRGRSPR